MRPLRVVVRERAAALKLDLGDIAKRLGMDPGNFRGVLAGSRAVPLDDAEEWCRALELTGSEAEELIDAMHLASCTERVRALVDRLEDEARAGRRMRERYAKRVAMIRFVLDRIDAPEVEDDTAAERAADELNLADLVQLLEDLVRTAGRSITVARDRSRPAPPPDQPGADG